MKIGKRQGMAFGADLFTAAGQSIYSTASGIAAVLAAPGTASYLTHDGTTPAWTATPTTVGVAQGAVVTSDVTHAQSSSTLSDITGLLVPVTTSATERWFIELFLLVTAASNTPRLKVGFSVPAAATMQWGPLSPATNVAGWAGYAAASSPSAINTESSTQVFGTATVTMGLALAGTILSGGTAGNVQAQFAQNVPDASNLVVKAGSFMRYTKTRA